MIDRGKVTALHDIATTNSYWADAAVAVMRPHLIDGMDGALMQSRVDEIAELLESNIKKEHVRLHANDRSAEAWFENDILVKGQILRNGHTIHYRLA